MIKVLHMLHSLDTDPGMVGTTVRRGIKWKGSVGDTLILCVCSDRCLTTECSDPDGEICDNCDRQGEGIVHEEWFGRFINVPAKAVEYEHEESSRMYSGLLSSMERAYGPGFTEESVVTILSYERLT